VKNQFEDGLLEVCREFRSHCESVNQLVHFDDDILGFAVNVLRELEASEEGAGKRMKLKNAMSAVVNAKENKSLKGRYEVILNQCLVLLVSYFGSALSDMYRLSVSEFLFDPGSEYLKSKEIKVSVEEIFSYEVGIGADLGSILIDKAQISFQDMQSVSRTFKDYFGVDIAKDSTVNDIIAIHIARHAIVHNAAKLDNKRMKTLTGAVPRNLFLNAMDGVAFKVTEEVVAASIKQMEAYLTSLTRKLVAARENPPSRAT